MNIVLIGYRGTGKSAVADQIAHVMGATAYHMDAEIEARVGRPISEFVAVSGWDAFREVETEVARVAGALQDAVIDTGGGVVLRKENIEALRRNGLVFWLKAPVETIQRRIGEDASRPSLTGDQSPIEEVAPVLSERTPSYQAASDFQVDTDGRAVDAIAGEIIDLFNKREMGEI